MNTVCLSENANMILKQALISKGYELIGIKQTDAVYNAVSSHADVYLCKIGAGLVVAPEQLSLIQEELMYCGAAVIPGASGLGFEYPENVKYNAAIIGNSFIHNTRYTDSALLDKARELELEPIHVKQGYTKCNLVVVDDRSVITSDMGLSAALIKAGFDVLSVSHGHVKLAGFRYGFLGGTSGRVGGEVIFNGDLSSHPDFDRINKFILDRGLQTVYFKEYPLEDIGSIIQL